MTQDIYIGIDGGATKCKVRIEDAQGNLLGQAVGGPANIRLSADLAWQSIFYTIDEIVKPLAMSLADPRFRFHAGMGLAGCEVEEARTAFLEAHHPFATLRLVSDAHIACIGAHRGQDGAIIIIGTGMIGYQVQQGVSGRVGGWGFPHDDLGSGAWLGLEATRLTFQWLDQRLDKAPLMQEVFAYFDNDLSRFVCWANQANSSEFAKLAPLVINHSQQGEAAAVKLMKKAAHEVDRVSIALEKSQSLPTGPIPCCLFGGIAPFLEAYLSNELRARLVTSQGDANQGAIWLAKQPEMVVKGVAWI